MLHSMKSLSSRVLNRKGSSSRGDLEPPKNSSSANKGNKTKDEINMVREQILENAGRENFEESAKAADVSQDKRLEMEEKLAGEHKNIEATITKEGLKKVEVKEDVKEELKPAESNNNPSVTSKEFWTPTTTSEDTRPQTITNSQEVFKIGYTPLSGPMYELTHLRILETDKSNNWKLEIFAEDDYVGFDFYEGQLYYTKKPWTRKWDPTIFQSKFDRKIIFTLLCCLKRKYSSLENDIVKNRIIPYLFEDHQPLYELPKLINFGCWEGKTAGSMFFFAQESFNNKRQIIKRNQGFSVNAKFTSEFIPKNKLDYETTWDH